MKAFNYLENDRFVQLISSWARGLDMAIKRALWLEKQWNNRPRRSIHDTIQGEVRDQLNHNHHIMKRTNTNRQQQLLQQSIIHQHIGLSDFNFRRMRRAASFSYADKMKCTPEGGRVDSKGRISLCETCSGHIDFGPDV